MSRGIEMTKLKKNLLVPLAIGLIGIFYLYTAFKLPIGHLNAPDRGFMPVIIGFVLICLCILEIIVATFRPNENTERSILSEDEAVESTGSKKPFYIMAALLIYCLFFNKLGFIVATIPLTFVMLRIMEYKSWWVDLIVAVIITLVIDFVFSGLLGVYFPSGILG